MSGGNVTTWRVQASPQIVPTPAAKTAPVGTQTSFLGYGLLTPFQRGSANDFAAAGGLPLVQSCAAQVLGTKCQGPKGQGEVRWRTDFGSLLHTLRHKNATAMTQLMARKYAQDALARWEPRVRVSLVTPFEDPGGEKRGIFLRVVFDLVDSNPASNRVILPGQTVDIPVSG